MIESIIHLFCTDFTLSSVVKGSVDLTKIYSDHGFKMISEPSFAPKRTLRGLLQRWREKLASAVNEGV